jgi:high-affinity Fe2+/Pb2+ permease
MVTRSQADRDATTVEIGYALVSAVFLACVTGLVVASPVLLLDLRGPAMKIVSGIALVFAFVVLLWRLISVLWRFDHHQRD